MTWLPTAEEEAEEIAFRRLYGDWDARDPAGTAEFMAGYLRECGAPYARNARTIRG